MARQHEAYLEALSAAGLEVVVLDPQPDYPDAHFVEDTAVVTPDVAVITIPGADARQGEEESIVPVLAEFRKITRIQAPGTVDGGDVLQVGNHFFIGISQRTNRCSWPQISPQRSNSKNMIKLCWTVQNPMQPIHCLSISTC